MSKNLLNANNPNVGSINFKNRIINGDFQVWQRGESFSFNANQSGTYYADRFFTSNITDGTFTITKSTLLNKNSCKITINTEPSDLTSTNHIDAFRYRFEGQHLYDLAINKKNVTISFWFNSNVVGEYPVCLRNYTQDGSGNAQAYVTTFNYKVANTPQKVIITIPLNADWNPTLVNDSNLGFELVIGFLNQGNYITSSTNTWVSGNYFTTSTAVNWGATAGNFIEIAELQLEEGNVATEFEQLPYEVQLDRCMRYYEYYNEFHHHMHHVNYGSQICLIPIYMKKEKRIAPSVSYVNDSSNLDLSVMLPEKNLIHFQYSVNNDGATAWINLYNVKIDAEL